MAATKTPPRTASATNTPASGSMKKLMSIGDPCLVPALSLVPARITAIDASGNASVETEQPLFPGQGKARFLVGADQLRKPGG